MINCIMVGCRYDTEGGHFMEDDKVLREYFICFLRDVRGVKMSAVNHYLGALNVISKYLVEHGKINSSIFEISDISGLEIVREYLYHQSDFVEKDKRGHQMYSAGLNNYIKFASGEEFGTVGKDVVQLDFAVPISETHTITIEQWKRKGIIKNQSIELAHYSCEIDEGHKTFIAASTNKQYMEGHHAIPYREQVHFDVSLDVYANIVCLCPICHRMLHYGLESEKKNALDKIYYDRAERFAKSGIKISRDEFIEIAI